MANQTKRIYRGCIVPQTVDTEVTENGEYPVQGKGVYKAISEAIEESASSRTAENVAHAVGEAPTAEEFNGLIDALIAAGLMAEPEPEPDGGDGDGDGDGAGDGEE